LSTSTAKAEETKPTAVPDPEPEEEEGVAFLTIRGKTYRIDELEQKQYEDIQRKSEVPDEKNEGATVTDVLLLEKLLTLAAVTIVEKKGDPPGQKLDPEAWGHEKVPVVTRVLVEVRRAHYMALTDDQLAAIKAQEQKRPNP